MSRIKAIKPGLSLQSGFKRLRGWFTGPSAKCAVVILMGSIVLFGLFAIACISARYDLKVGDIAHTTITATKDVEDTVTTEQHRKAAASAVEASYHLQDGATEAVLMALDDLLGQLYQVQQYGMSLRTEEEQVLYGPAYAFSDEEVNEAQKMVTGIVLSPYQARVLLRTETADFNNMVAVVRESVEKALNTTIREGQVTYSINSIMTLCSYEVSADLNNNIVRAVLNATVKPNLVLDEAATEAARIAARASVEPVIYKQGQNIIREGERVSEYQIAMLNALGMLDTASIDLKVYQGGALVVSTAVILLVILLHMLHPSVLRDLRRVTVIMLVMVICVGLGVGVVKLINVYLIPVALGAMLLTGLVGSRTGLSAGVSLSIILAGLAAASNHAYSTEMVHLLLTGVVGSAVTVQFLAGKPQRVRTVICGVLVAAVNLVVLLSIGLMTAADLDSTIQAAIWSMSGGVLGGLIAVGFQPVFEAAFNLATPSKLLELANPNQPLLRRLLLEAPGTYHHSIVVANLSEAAAERIGANPLLARTGAYFHDIGKLKRPMYFKENQRGENPHDSTDAYVSAAIVTSHTSDGLALAQKYHLPPEIQQIIYEHHGDTPVMYFYHKALQQANGTPVDVKDFRYSGTRPATKESAVVMLADTIEAAVRSMSDPTPQAIERFIERLVRGKLEDGQLSNSPLTLLDIDGICEAFSKVLSGVFHERIEYPTVQMNHGEAVQAAKPSTGPQSPAKPAVTGTGPLAAVKPVQGSGSNAAVKPAAPQAAPVQPVAKPIAQSSATVSTTKPHAAQNVPVPQATPAPVNAKVPVPLDPSMPEPYAAPMPDSIPEEKKPEEHPIPTDGEDNA